MAINTNTRKIRRDYIHTRSQIQWTTLIMYKKAERRYCFMIFTTNVNKFLKRRCSVAKNASISIDNYIYNFIVVAPRGEVFRTILQIN
jgi:hypothetical protein